MTPTPISPPGGGAATPSQQPGSSYVASGNCSGTAFTHTQSILISYAGSKEITIAPTWLPTTGSDVSGYLCDVYLQYTDTIEQFSTSANDVSACSNAANSREMQVLDISSFTHTTGFGANGIISTSANGFVRRWVQQGDTADQYASFFTKVWFPVDDATYNASIHNDNIAGMVVRRMVEQIAAGGVQYDAIGGSAGGDFIPPIPKFNTNLIYI